MKTQLNNQILTTGLFFLSLIISSQPLANTLFPNKQLYPHYLADPTRVTFSAQVMRFIETTIDQTSDRRLDLKIGAPLPVYEINLFDQPWQLVLIAGFHGQFDRDNSQDNIGWDGIYGLHIATRANEAWAYRVGVKHISSHVGDEYAERTGRQRINYTREEIRAGVAWSGYEPLTLYADIAYAYDLRNDVLQAPWRVQFGGQYHYPKKFWDEQLQWYSAIDVSSYEESDWQRNVTVQIGLAAKSGLHTWRLALEYYNGRSQIGEFFQDQETYLGIGLWFDL